MQLKSVRNPVRAGEPVRINVQLERNEHGGDRQFFVHPAGAVRPAQPHTEIDLRPRINHWLDVEFPHDGDWEIDVVDPAGQNANPEVIPIHVFPPAAPAEVSLRPGNLGPGNGDQALWEAIRQVGRRVSYERFDRRAVRELTTTTGPSWYGTTAYEQLRAAADDFLDARATTFRPGNEAVDRSYVARISEEFAHDADATELEASGRRIRRDRVRGAEVLRAERAVALPLGNVPFVELIWNYWMEEGMVVQSLNHIVARFQNRRTRGGDALTRFDLNPLLPLRNLMWGFAEDERRRLTVRRRAAEYQYQYGLTLIGRAVPPASTLVERRSPFLEAFHALLNSAHTFYKERDDLTRQADGFPLLGALREVHLLLAQGAHNQFADLVVTARAEMLTMQWLLARHEMALFLGGRPMVPFQEPWMDRVDTMKSLHGWADASIAHFLTLAQFGEQVLLSVRHGDWNNLNREPADAQVWADTWRPEIQNYIQAYRAVTGVDLSTGVDATMPSTLLARRLHRQRRRA